MKRMKTNSQKNVIDTAKIFQIKQDIAKLLEEKPELRELQAEIDEALRKCGNSHHNKMAVLSQMMRESLKELGDACNDAVGASKVLSDGPVDPQ